MATHQKKHNRSRGLQELIIASSNEYYAQASKALGDCRFEVKILENESLVVAKCKGALTHGPGRRRIFAGDYILIQKMDSKYYIIHKYSADDAKRLCKLGEFKLIKSNESNIVFDTDVVEVATHEIDNDFIDAI